MASRKMTAQDVLSEYYGETIQLPVDVVGIAKSQGIEVYKIKFRPPADKDMLGLIQKRDNSVRIIVNSEDIVTRRRFTIAHELGHFFLHHNGYEIEYLDKRSNTTNPEETEANRFAAELLMPEDLLRREYDKLMFPTARQLSRVFKVSEQAMSVRLKSLKMPYIGEN